jgi:hypothetical protein
MEDLLGTCGDDCARSCRAAEAYRGNGSPLVVTLVVLLLLFMTMDAMIACVAIYRAGHPSARPGTRTGAAVQSSSGPRSGARALGGSGT